MTVASASRRSLAVDLGLSLWLAVVYFLLARIGMLFSVHETYASFVWLPAGFALASVLLAGPGMAIGIAMGAFASHFEAGETLLPALAIAAGNSVSALAGAWILERKLNFSRTLDEPRDLLALIGIGAFASPILAATIGACMTARHPAFGWSQWPELWAGWWAADAVGILLLTPLLLAWIGQRAQPPARSPALLLNLLQLAVGICAFMLHMQAGVYVYVTLAVICAMHVSLTSLMLVNLLTFTAAALGVLIGAGPFAGPSLHDSLLTLQTFGVVSSLAALLVSALTAERTRAQARLRSSLERFEQLTSLSADWYWEQDENLRFTQLAGRAVEQGQIDVDSLLGKTRWEIEALDTPPESREVHDRAVAERKPFHDVEIVRRALTPERRVVSVSGAPVFDEQGQFRGYRGVARDITLQKQAEREISEARRFLDAIVNAIPAPVLVKDDKHRYVAVNASFCRLFGRSAEQVIGRTDHDFFPPEQAAYFEQTDDEALAGAAVEYERAYEGPRGNRWLLVRKAPLTRPDGNRLVVMVLIDVTGRRAAEQQVRANEQRFRDFAHAAGEFVWETDLEGRFTFVSTRVQSVWGFSEHELIGRKASEFMPDGEADRVAAWLEEHRLEDQSFRDLEHMIVTRDGETRWLLINAVGIFEPSGALAGWRGTGRDITDRKTAQARINYLATRDPLTELPNRVLFNDRLEQGIVAARRSGQSLAVMFIDLDRFKNINDSLGHQVGDHLLKQVAARMLECIRKGDTLSRLGGDEFVVTLEGLQQAEDAAQVASKIIKALARPFEILGHTLNTSCSIGISIFPFDGDDERALMKNADTAMYHAKEKGRNNYQFFSPEMNTRAVERHTLETALRRAIEEQQFKLYYQPLVSMHTGKVVGVESLLRWQHPTRGLLHPTTFIGVAEESGLIEPIGQWVLRTACQRAKAWQDAGYPEIKIAVNISARQLNRPREFARGLSRVLSATGLEPRYLELEMTESLLIQNAEENIATLRKLGQEGMRIAVDDFGTGYSSLQYLRQLPVDTLKIDRSFVRDIESDPEDAAIIQAIMAMGHSLGLHVTAEGVENRGQLEALSRMGCDEYQGFLFSKPLPAVEIAAKYLAPGVLDFETAAAKRREVRN
jgi:diguanylate cyclase (GGDEF)-like protein/PAS domain S-box-containing protein